MHPLWLRCEKKQFERRSALTPTTAKQLIDAHFQVFVERDQQRAFQDHEFEDVGCTMVPNNSWPTAPLTTPILGLKELEALSTPLTHTHIHFAHVYKNQAGWSKELSRFAKGGGTLYDLEFLTDSSGRRVAAFGFHAGFAGAAAGVLAFAAAKKGQQLSPLDPYENEEAMVRDVRSTLGDGSSQVRVLVMGALGRCGSGAVDLLRKAGLQEQNILKWDLAETTSGGPFLEILGVDIFVNCIYLNSSIPPFLTKDFIAEAGSNCRLSVVVDVSCDTTNPFNPIPIYSETTTFDKPTLNVDVGVSNVKLAVVAIDHLPTLLPREASEQFSRDLLPSLLTLPDRHSARVWTDAETLFKTKLQAAINEESKNIS